ncbi:hypothetical protein C8Q79DRAFT_929632 [Trametes meyenii]|nr:hypothetical protein C8Q79DRAFT_929632 [Trametes meyenii]
MSSPLSPPSSHSSPSLLLLLLVTRHLRAPEVQPTYAAPSRRVNNEWYGAHTGVPLYPQFYVQSGAMRTMEIVFAMRPLDMMHTISELEILSAVHSHWLCASPVPGGPDVTPKIPNSNATYSESWVMRDSKHDLSPPTVAMWLRAKVDAMDVEVEAEPAVQTSPTLTGITTALAHINANIAGLRTDVLDRHRDVDDQIQSLWTGLNDLSHRLIPPRDKQARSGRYQRGSKDTMSTDDEHEGKDSSANYLRLIPAEMCIRKHAKSTLDDQLPSAEQQTQLLELLALGGALEKPFLYDWSSPPSTSYNQCIVEAFCVDFWDRADAGEYDVDEIPLPYQGQERFVAAVQRHLGHRRRKWLKTHQEPISDAQKQVVARHYARNSRVRTVSSPISIRALELMAVLDLHESTQRSFSHPRPGPCKTRVYHCQYDWHSRHKFR